MTPQFRRLLDLVRKTGDRLVVTDPEGDDVFVLLGLDAYEALLGDNLKTPPSPSPVPRPLTPPQPPTSAPLPEPLPPHDIWDAMAPAGGEGDTWSAGDLTPDDLLAAGFSVMPDVSESVEPLFETDSAPLAVPSEIVLPTEQVKTPEKKADDEEFGEEQFYLEPIE